MKAIRRPPRTDRASRDASRRAPRQGVGANYPIDAKNRSSLLTPDAAEVYGRRRRLGPGLSRRPGAQEADARFLYGRPSREGTRRKPGDE
jgi:hypothetical protein